jgi:hypothetical protein
MTLRSRFLLWSAAAATSFLVDVATKAVPHTEVVNNHSHTPGLMLLLVAIFLCALGLWHSRTLAVGAGFMLGGLLGNGGQLVLFGYASDWIPVGGWLTNVADISGAVGLICCLIGYALSVLRRPRPIVSR